MSKTEYSFKRGYIQLSIADIPGFREKIMKRLNIRSRMSFHLRLNGEVEPKVSEAKAIEEVFSEYGIKEVWGDGRAK